jgi:methionyl-tRNA formyltransferase
MDGCVGCVAREETRSVEAAIMGLLLNFDAGSIWAVEELVRQLSAPRLEVIDGLAELAAAGLVHRLDDFVFATRAASSFDRLDL